MPLFSQHTARFSPDVPLEGTSSRELLKRYQPLETLATGGFGSIEICRDTHLRRRVAIKRIPLINGAGMPASDIMDVLREAHTAAMLQHPNIVQVIDLRTTQPMPTWLWNMSMACRWPSFCTARTATHLPLTSRGHCRCPGPGAHLRP